MNYSRDVQTKTHYNNFLGGDDDELPPGKYVYPFSFLLPDNLPSTYDSEYGYIRYKIEAVVNRPWKFDYECDIFIIVVSPIDLNKILHVKVT